MARRFKELCDGWLNPLCGQYGLTPAQGYLLLALHCEGPQTAGQLASITGMAKGNSSVLCKQLQQKGLVTRGRLAGDERCVVVALSPKGRRTAAEIETQLKHRAAPLQKEVSMAQLVAANRQLAHINTRPRPGANKTRPQNPKEKDA